MVAVNFQTRAEEAEAVAAQIRSAGGRAIVVARGRLGRRAGRRYGGARRKRVRAVDMLVNNAGVLVTGVREEDFDRGSPSI